jgi:hypothetical protein
MSIAQWQGENRNSQVYRNQPMKDRKIVATQQPHLIDLAFPLADNRADSGYSR